jgi:hypothetical protein
MLETSVQNVQVTSDNVPSSRPNPMPSTPPPGFGVPEKRGSIPGDK